MNGLVIAVVALGLLFLHVFYRAAEAQWPLSYYAVGRDLDRRISSNPLAYLLFRFAPVWLTTTFCSVVLRRAAEPVVWPMVMLCLLHAGATAIRALVVLIRSGQVRTRPLATATHVVTAVGVIVVGTVASTTSAELDGAIPPSHEVTTALWTALMASLVGAYVLKITRTDGEDTFDVLERSRLAIPEDLWLQATAAAATVDSEERLVQAFLLVENLQRPSWVRRVERVGGRLLGAATYGPLQVRSIVPMHDEAALDLAIRQWFAGQRVPIVTNDYGYELPDWEWLRLFALAYNPSTDFASNVATAYSWLEAPRRSTAVTCSTAIAADQLPLIEVHTFGRGEGRLYLAGSAAVLDGNVLLVQMDARGAALHTDYTTTSTGDSMRGTYSTTIEVVEGAVTVAVGGEPMDEENPTTVTSRWVRIPVGMPTEMRGRPTSP